MSYRHPFLTIFLSIMFAFAIGVALNLYGAWAFMLGWNWFVVRATGFPAISYGLSLGLILFGSLTRFIIASNDSKENKDNENESNSVGVTFLKLTLQGFGFFLGISLSLCIMAIVYYGLL